MLLKMWKNVEHERYCCYVQQSHNWYFTFGYHKLFIRFEIVCDVMHNAQNQVIYILSGFPTSIIKIKLKNQTYVLAFVLYCNSSFATFKISQTWMEARCISNFKLQARHKSFQMKIEKRKKKKKKRRWRSILSWMLNGEKQILFEWNTDVSMNKRIHFT